MDTSTTKTIHEGRNVKRFREMLGIKQEALAAALGDEWNQKKISLLEAKDKLEAGILEDVAKALKVPVEAIKNFDEEAALLNIQNNYDGSVINAGPTINYQCTIDPIDKMIQLYERMLKEKDEKIELLQKLFERK
ncbi:helix-turn-helix transcriptional regulator [Lacibacter sp.]|uniref:helix-turn-helix domain-containing protein n=1 Tax=Lacibacter sp. TaxID=1915409 RepID=UPI002B4B7851|nr:helix-turn-helix transcriptional regulator [Lacibacter sp.]HLP36576.1 helix-turn-helix transcriptional regulator [Lacibacter sp.]